MDAEPTLPESHFLSLPSFSADDVQDTFLEPRLSKEEEDALLKDTTASFADWVTSFVRRVIQLLENLPDEGANDVGGSETEGWLSRDLIMATYSDISVVQVVDAVAGACRQICVHLSEPLFDLVLKMVFEYASTNVRPNAVRAVHQLVECLANANPIKTLAKFFPFCAQSIRTELEHGASSLRTTSASSPLPSDATLHWSWCNLTFGVMSHSAQYRCRSGHLARDCVQVGVRVLLRLHY
jgi:proteasome activator subunit 4